MEPTTGKHSFLRNVMARVLLFGVLIIIVRFAFVVTIAGESCNIGDFCFFSLPENFSFIIAGSGARASAVNRVVRPAGPTQPDLYTSKDWIKAVHFYSSVFQDLITEGYLSPNSKSLCVETPNGQDVYALKEIGVSDSVGIFKKAFKPLVISSKTNRIAFDDDTFDFVFSGQGGLDKASRPLDLASEISRTLKPEGFVVVHVRAKDTYSFNSFLDLFNSCKLIKSHNIDGYDSSMPYIREIILQKHSGIFGRGVKEPGVNSVNKCSVPEHKRDLVRNAEPLIKEEP
ncbi:hypothetical protein GH714_018592 [Hevea brasiliensis]|nr:hypothetical protein GH714_018592 [Hevea brasiliensis]